MKYRYLLILLLFMVSCLSDDYSDCPSGYTRVRVLFDWEMGPGTYAVSPEEVRNIDLFIFDSNGMLTGWLTDNGPDLTAENYYQEALLPYGTYRVVSWINVGESYRFDPLEPATFSEAKVILDNVETNLTPLYYGSESNLTLTAESATEDGFLPVTISLTQNTNTLNFSITGGEPGEAYALSIIDDNGSYNFDNTIVPTEELHYITSLDGETEEVLTGRLVVGKLTRDRHPQVRVTNTNSGEVVYQASLTALLLREETEDNPLDIENTHVFDIPLDITLSPEAPVQLLIGYSWEEAVADGMEGIRSSEAKSIDLFIFDSEGLFIKHMASQDISLTQSSRITTELPAGVYSLVSWFNLSQDYTISPEFTGITEGVTTLREAYVTLSLTGGQANVTSGSPLLYGSVINNPVNNLLAGSDGYQHVILPLTQNTYELTFTLKGELTADSYLLELQDNHGRYDFMNSFAVSRQEIRYSSSVSRSGSGTYTGELSVERLERGRQPQFSVKTSSGRVLYESGLVEMILERETSGSPIDFGKMHRFNIELEFTEKGDGSFNVEVTINGWKVNDENGVLG